MLVLNGTFDMITFTQGNLLDAQTDVLVNTVNTVGVMGKGIALMFKERFPKNMAEYNSACKLDLVHTGKMFVTKTGDLVPPYWIVNFPTKQHWKNRSQLEWIDKGLDDLKQFIVNNNIKSIAIPPLGAGNGGLEWQIVKSLIVAKLADLEQVDILIFEPSLEYQNVSKKKGVEKLTPARALTAEIIRRYWILGMECSQLEIQKLVWFLQRSSIKQNLENPFNLDFKAHYYGPFAKNLNHLLNSLDGSYLKSEKRIPDIKPLDVIWFNEEKQPSVVDFMENEANNYQTVLSEVSDLIDGFESPFGMELLATVDWLISKENCELTVASIRQGITHWKAGSKWANRKNRLFDDSHIEFALQRLENF